VETRYSLTSLGMTSSFMVALSRNGGLMLLTLAGGKDSGPPSDTQWKCSHLLLSRFIPGQSVGALPAVR
jgi:hypothetical protein